MRQAGLAGGPLISAVPALAHVLPEVILRADGDVRRSLEIEPPLRNSVI